MSNKGLGKGLAALLGNLQEEEAAAEKADACLDCINLLHFRVNITAAPFMIYYNVF